VTREAADSARASDLSGLVKAYDVRGVVPDQLDEQVARALGAAVADVQDVA
jgi:phosphomannomutase